MLGSFYDYFSFLFVILSELNMQNILTVHSELNININTYRHGMCYEVIKIIYEGFFLIIIQYIRKELS